jgi:hypothetical protein
MKLHSTRRWQDRQDRHTGSTLPNVALSDQGSAPPRQAGSGDPSAMVPACRVAGAVSGSAQLAEVGFISLRELIVLRKDVTAARMRSRSSGRGMDRSASARAVAAA